MLARVSVRGSTHASIKSSLAASSRATSSVSAGSNGGTSLHDIFRPTDEFVPRHIGPTDVEVEQMLQAVGCTSLEDLSKQTVPQSIVRAEPLGRTMPQQGLTESQALASLREMLSGNQVLRSMIGMGYYGTHTPPVILRNMIENPGWYTAYTPYQSEIAQGRLEMLLNFQTMVSDLTGLPIANASLLDEATAAAEAMSLAHGQAKGKRSTFLVDEDTHPQTLAVIRTRAEALGLTVQVSDAEAFDFSSGDVFGAFVQYPSSKGSLRDHAAAVQRAHDGGALFVVASDLLALSLVRPPAEFGADIVVGSAQRFGVPMGFGGPHAAFMAVGESMKRKIPGRIIGVSKDRRGGKALRMALQTREQHIRRDRATSNICTAQALLANTAAAYAIYHGPEGIQRIARRVHAMASAFSSALDGAGYQTNSGSHFDTVAVSLPAGTTADAIAAAAREEGILLRTAGPSEVVLSFDETSSADDLTRLARVFSVDPAAVQAAAAAGAEVPAAFARSGPILTHPVFSSHTSETRMLRYLHALESRDLSLNTSMISLGSCTMKLNATSEMIPITWPEVNALHPFAPPSTAPGYTAMIEHLNAQLSEITGFAAVSAQPNSGAQGEYAGLLCIRNYHLSRGDAHRTVCLIPTSAHGTNPASAVMCGMQVVAVKNDAEGNIDVADLRAKAEQHADRLAALMVTYPSTYGVFEETVREMCDVVHAHGGQVYMDGANMNAQVGLTSPGDIGADVCHLNLHKTFCIPHGGGGPGVGSIGVAAHLAPFLPGHPVIPTGGEGDHVVAKTSDAVSAAPFGSASILPITWMYINMMGAAGLKQATQVAILNANYMATRLQEHYPVVFRGAQGRVAHEFIVDMRAFKKHGIVEEDVAKRLADYGFHAPTMSWPVSGTLMIEPTESEDKGELDRFCDAMISIRKEIQDVIDGKADPENNVLKNAPHTAAEIASEDWNMPYSREQAAYPLPWVRANKFWPSISRVDNAFGDRNLVCSCPPVDEYDTA